MKQKIHLSSDVSVGEGDCHRKNLAELLTNMYAWDKAEEQRLCIQGCFIRGAVAILLSPPLVQVWVTLVGHLMMTYEVEDYFCPWELWK